MLSMNPRFLHSQDSVYTNDLGTAVDCNQQPEYDCTLTVMPGQLHGRTLMKSEIIPTTRES